MTFRHWLRTIAAALCALACITTGTSHAQSYPAKPIPVIKAGGAKPD